MIPLLMPLASTSRAAAVAAFVALTLLGGCATSKTLRPAPGQAEAAGDLVVEHTHRVTVRLLTPSYSRETAELPTFALAVENRGDDPVVLDPAKVRAASGTAPVHLYTPVELIAMVRADANREAEAYSGQQAEVYLSGGASPTAGQDNSAAIAKIEGAKRTNTAAAEFNVQRDEQMREIASLVIPMSIPPGESGGGLLKLRPEDFQRGEPLRLEVDLEGETYTFIFLPGEA
ncbi:MAG: hypothetical protein ACLFR7_07595 [Opitutales bacterium]